MGKKNQHELQHSYTTRRWCLNACKFIHAIRMEWHGHQLGNDELDLFISLLSTWMNQNSLLTRVDFACLKFFEQKPSREKGIFLLCPGSVVPRQNKKLIQMKTKSLIEQYLHSLQESFFLACSCAVWSRPPPPPSPHSLIALHPKHFNLHAFRTFFFLMT